jgi:Zn-dependent protease
MSEIEDEIRRQLLAEREAALQAADNAPISHAQPDSPTPLSPGSAPPTPPRRKGLLGSMGAIGALIAKFWGVALSVLLKLKSLLFLAKLGTFAKFAIAGGSMLFSMFVMSRGMGWGVGAGIVILIAIHECGHALAAHRLGHRIGMMVFIPFCGAFVTSRGSRSVTEGAFIGIMGPIAGTLASVGCVAIYLATGKPLWLVLAYFGFLINLINLAPAPPLDGGWLLPIFSPKLLLPCVIIALILFHNNPMLWILALMSIPRLMHAWKHGNSSAYYVATNRDRWIYGIAWAALVLFLGTGMLLIPHLLHAGHFIA